MTPPLRLHTLANAGHSAHAAPISPIPNRAHGAWYKTYKQNALHSELVDFKNKIRRRPDRHLPHDPRVDRSAKIISYSATKVDKDLSANYIYDKTNKRILAIAGGYIQAHMVGQEVVLSQIIL